MRRRIIVCVAALIAAAGLIVSPAQAAPPQCGNGPIVMDGCTGPGVCTAVIDGQCVGVQPPMLPPPPDVRVGLEGGIGIG